MTEKIVVGYDGSECARGALQVALTLARRLDGELFVVVGCAPKGIPFDLAGTVVSHRHELEAACSRELVDVQEACASAGVPAITRVLYEHPAQAIAATAMQEHAELVVVGAHGDGLHEGVFGSTVHRLLTHSTVPVVVVPNRL
jgi:nucleotide-binding universal stress UspA family protein